MTSLQQTGGTTKGALLENFQAFTECLFNMQEALGLILSTRETRHDSVHMISACRSGGRRIRRHGPSSTTPGYLRPCLKTNKQTTNQPLTPRSVSYIVNVNIQKVIKTDMILYLGRTAEGRWAATIYFSKEKKNLRCLHGIKIRY